MQKNAGSEQPQALGSPDDWHSDHQIFGSVEALLQERPEKEMSTQEVGNVVMDELKGLDKVAYVRFASVYRHFRDLGEFMTELRDLLDTK